MSQLIDERLARLRMLSVQELESGARYRCRSCRHEWRLRDDPYWWRCPTKGCADWMESAGPAVSSACRVLRGQRPEPVPGAAPAGVGGRPRGPKIPLHVILETFERMKTDYGRYPPDADLAQELEVSRRTVQNWRAREYLPPRETS